MVMLVSKSAPRAAAKVVAALAVVGVVLMVASPRASKEMTSSSHDPILIYCTRTIAPGKVDAYKESWTAFANYVFEKTPGCKAIFAHMKAGEPDKTLQFYYFDSVASFFAQPQDKPELSAALWANYGGTKETDVCQVFGGWTPTLKEIADTIPGVHYVMKPPVAGFMKPRVDFAGPPVVFLSKRLSTDPEDMAYGIQKSSDAWFTDSPGLIAALDFVSEDDPMSLWDLRLMSNYNDGFLGHLAPTVFPIIVKYYAPTMADPNFMDAVVFCSRGEKDKMVALNPGNGVYEPYYWDEALGPLPDFTK